MLLSIVCLCVNGFASVVGFNSVEVRFVSDFCCFCGWFAVLLLMVACYCLCVCCCLLVGV